MKSLAINDLPAYGWHKSVDETVRNNQGLVARVAKYYHARVNLSERVDFEDLMQEGRIGVVEAWRRFDPARGLKFSTYAIYWIRQRMARYLTANASELHVPIATKTEQTRAAAAIARKKCVRLDDPWSGSDDGSESDLSGVLGSDDLNHEANSERMWKRAQVERLMRALTPRERVIVREFFEFVRYSDKVATLQSVADRHGVSKERVRQIVAKAVEKMRAEFERGGKRAA